MKFNPLKKMKLGAKLLIAFFLVGVIPALVVGFLALQKASDALEVSAYNQLTGVREIKKEQINRFFAERQGDMGVLMETVRAMTDASENSVNSIQMLKKSRIESFFAERRGDVSVLSTNDTVVAALAAFDEAFTLEGDAVDGPQWQAVDARFGNWLSQYNSEYGYYDVFLINAEGKVVYTVGKEADIGQDLVNGALKDSGLGKVFAAGRQGIAIEDFEPYAPSNGAQAAFISAPVNVDGNFAGVVALQLSDKAIGAMVQDRVGLGKTGESYLVGRRDGGKSSYRSARLVKGGGKYVIGYAKSGSFVKEAFAGNSGTDIKLGSSGSLEVVGFAPLKIAGLDWVIMTTVALEEVLVNQIEGDEKDYFGKYIDKYGYYDLFLISASGKVFYTVTKEADFNTNMVDGKYKDSGLGQLTRRVLETQNYEVTDIAPYAPSNGDPAAFIAQPMTHEGEVEMIVALQLSLDAINTIMQQREGMGESGETYLIGQDMRMRSDSFLDAEGHSVVASFAGTVAKNGVDTEAATEALKGTTGAKIVIDYNGNPVLSAYTPVKVGDTNWALLAEIDESEAFAPVYQLEMLMAIVALVASVVIVLVAFLIGRTITRPVIEALKASEAIASGDLSHEIEVKSSDEIGQLSAAMKSMQGKLSQAIEHDVLGMVEAAKSGDLSQRIELEGKEGCYQELSSGMNELIEVNQQVIEDSSRVFGALARGDLSQTINGDYQGSFEELKESANSSVAKQSQVTEIIGRDFHLVVDAAVHGDLSKRIDTSLHEGVFAQLGTELNELIEIAERGLGDVGRVLQALSQGDLTETIDNDYQGTWQDLKTDANATVDKLKDVVGQIVMSAAEVSRGAAEISEGNTALSGRTEEQASNLEETASAMEEIASTVKQSAGNAQQANQLVDGARSQAEHGSGVASQAVTAMAEISDSSRKIADIISVIDEIAFQTNLLALNAAVEAARAGEQGRGFAVVASEVRNLAGRSATAAKEIKTLIEDSVNRVKEGSRLVDESGQSLDEIMSSVKKVSDIVAEIAAASREQSEGIEQINKAVMQVDEMTQQNAALVEEAASASASVGDQASNLDEMVAFFRTDSQAAAAPRAAAPVAAAPERRSKERPWHPAPAAQEKSAPAPAPVEMAAAGGAAPEGDSDWEEF